MTAKTLASTRFGCTTSTFRGKLPQKLSAMAKAGFAATELWPSDLFEHAEGPDIAIDALRASGLEISVYQALRNYEGMGASVRAHKLKIAAQMMDQMALLRAGTLVLCSNTAPDCGNDRKQIVDDLRRLGDLAQSKGVRIAYEAVSWGQWITDYRDAADLILTVDHDCVGLMLDSFHVFVLDLPVDAIAAISGEKIFHVEIADLPRMNAPPIEISRHYRLCPGEGAYPVQAFVDAVAKTGYQGFVTVEIFNAHYRELDPDDVAGRAFRALSALYA